MSQFKRFNASENDNYNSSDAYPEGTLTWDPDNGLRIHDGNTGGGNSVSGTVYWGDVQNKPYGSSGIHDILGGGSSANTGKFLKQTDTTTSEWASLPTTYDTLTIDTKIIGGIDGAAGARITGIESGLGYGTPYQYAFTSGNAAFNNLFNRGTSIIGWKMYPASDPSQFVTITQYLNYDLGAPGLGFDGALQSGPWVAESADYNAGTPGPLTLSADTKNWVLGTNGTLTLPAGGDIKDSNGDSVLLNSSTDAEFSGLYITGSNNTDDNEGGEIRLGLPVNSFGLSNFVSIDLYQNRLRIFENGVTARGVYLDLTKAASNVGTDLMPKTESPFTIKAENFTAEANTRYGIDTLGQARTVFLPVNPVAGTAVFFVDAVGSFNTNNLTIDGNGKNIMGSSTLVVSTANQSVGLFYNGGEWRTY